MIPSSVRLIAATRNPAKVAQFAVLVDGLATVEPLPADAILPVSDEHLEAGNDLRAIAAAKALAWSRQFSGALVIASDGGLLVPALGQRWNPARTRRFAGTKASDLDRARALLDMASDLVDERRTIGWRESIAIARDGSLMAALSAESARGVLAEDVDETLLAHARGFWIPTLWRCPTFDGRLLAELSAAERTNLDDHWHRLREPLCRWLRDYAAANRS